MTPLKLVFCIMLLAFGLFLAGCAGKNVQVEGGGGNRGAGGAVLIGTQF